MIAKIVLEENLLTATYERTFHHSVDDVWTYLTDNNKLQAWFPELEVQDLKNEGEILFHLPDGSHEKMHIINVVPQSIFAFTWDKNTVRFELVSKEKGCLLVFKEYLHEVTAHTPKDLAGWHVCLDVIGALLRGQKFQNREALWNTWYL